MGQEFTEEEDFAMALDAIAEMGPRNVLITHDDGCVALLREDGRCGASTRRRHDSSPVSAVGTGDVLLAGFLAARLEGRSAEEARGAPSRPERPPRSRSAPGASTCATSGASSATSGSVELAPVQA